ncbi:MAG: bifunctional folylpolyglutamate synthase/dihydrofolate synthase [Defluviitaleaceae bacterium]|nr:bifunctional folylpolyglutamate synthase/dihydrofolate synthase [Defluviitaleaceae bacterium]
MSAMTYDEALEFLESTHTFGSKLGLSRISALCGLLGNPEDRLKFVHIAGTNGKGSTAAYIGQVLMKAGYTTGCFTSPYIQRFTERITVNGIEISTDDITRYTQMIKREIDTMTAQGQEHPTAFEIYTAMCFLHFDEQKCDIVVLETGLGGVIDSTNVIKAKEAAVITNIGYDHMEQLGNSLEEIAQKKAGIITCPCDAVIYPMEPHIQSIFTDAAQAQGCRIHKLDPADIRVTGGFFVPEFDYAGLTGLTIKLLGEHQYYNASLAALACKALRGRGWNITDGHIREGLAAAMWPGRMEIMHSKPLMLIDGAHNTQGVDVLAKGLGSFKHGGVTFIVGVMRDKEYDQMLGAVAHLANRFLTITPDNERAMPAAELARFTQQFAPSTPFESVAEAIRFALDTTPEGEVICAFGSLYYIGQVREFFAKH